jgi:uncharacterized membrane protein
MFGFILGTACLIGLFWVVRGGRRFGGHSCGGWHGHRHGGRHDAHDEVHSGRWGFGRRAIMRWLFERLDTTPGQERVIRDAVENFVDSVMGARREVESSRADVARAMRSESFDAESMGEAFGKHDNVLSDLRKNAVEQLAKVHEVLDDKQRARLAELIEQGFARRWQGPYRSWS